MTEKTQTPPDLRRLPPDALLTRQQLMVLTGFSEQAFKKWAMEDRGPRFKIIEHRARYRVADVKAWLGMDGPASEAA